MATQYGEECWCSTNDGLNFNKHGESHQVKAECDYQCAGDEVRPSLYTSL